MIAFLRGVLLQKDINQIIVDVEGVGYQVAVSLQTACKLPDSGSRIELLIHTHVREDLIDLYGFLTEKEKKLFRMLLDVNGIGARSAMSVLSGMSTDDLIESIANGEVTKLTKIPGIGKKTAERVVLELKQAINKAWPQGAYERPRERRPLEEDVVSALVNLGYKAKDAEQAVEKVTDKQKTFEGLLKQTLTVMR